MEKVEDQCGPPLHEQYQKPVLHRQQHGIHVTLYVVFFSICIPAS